MNTYTIRRAGENSGLDHADTLYVRSIHWEPDNGCRMQAQIGWKEDGLYVHMRTSESCIRAENHSPYDMICEDSCMEFFFRPDENDPRYFNFEVNLNGWMYIGIGHDRHDSVRLFPHDQKTLFSVKTALTADGWELSYHIPLTFLQIFFPSLTLFEGKRIFANCFKCGDLTEKPHFMSWNPMTCEEPDFHRTCDFGEMILG